MTVVYLLLFLIPIYAELSSDIHTGGVLKKIWLMLVSLGGILAFTGHGSDLIAIGICLYFVQFIYYQHKYKHRRRHDLARPIKHSL